MWIPVGWPYGLCDVWNSGSCCGTAVTDSIDDMGFLRKMIEQLVDQYNIDENRIYTTGLSNGSCMAQMLVNKASDLIAASASMAQYLLAPPDPDYTPVSMMEIHGTEDMVVKYEKDYFPGAMENLETWRMMNNCDGTAVETWRSGDSYTLTYQNCDGGTEVSLVTVNGAGHVAYQGIQADINTSRMAWDFMKRFSK